MLLKKDVDFLKIFRNCQVFSVLTGLTYVGSVK